MSAQVKPKEPTIMNTENSGHKKLLFDLEETGSTTYRTEADKIFLEHLHDRLSPDKWHPEAFERDDRTIIIATVIRNGVLVATLRIDFFEEFVVFGYSPCHQLVEDLDPEDEASTVLQGLPLKMMADAAGDWMSQELEKWYPRPPR